MATVTEAIEETTLGSAVRRCLRTRDHAGRHLAQAVDTF